MDHTTTFEGYMLFRMSEAEHVAKNYPDTDWVSQSASAEYERYLLDAYDASLVPNPCVG